MRKSARFSAIILSIALSPLTTFAQTDIQYPAANFEPKVVFIDTAAVTNAKTPAQESSPTHAKQAEFDPQHPAAFFQPKIIYP
ncbi:MAG: hypothetical protein HOP02_02810 [Methylococcaceae bacterium]|nr:hypothetical protein [Methylococcaceae bacterium]